MGLDVSFGVSLGGSTKILESKRQADAWPTLAKIVICLMRDSWLFPTWCVKVEFSQVNFYLTKLLRQLWRTTTNLHSESKDVAVHSYDVLTNLMLEKEWHIKSFSLHIFHSSMKTVSTEKLFK